MPKILIIDDERSIRNTLKEILTYEGFEVVEAQDGLEGLKAVEKAKFDVILCDIKMPKMDGIEVLEKIQEMASETPVVIVSGHGNIDTAVEAIKKGAFDYIAKPLDLNRTLVTIRNAMDRSTLVNETKVSRMADVPNACTLDGLSRFRSTRNFATAVSPRFKAAGAISPC